MTPGPLEPLAPRRGRPARGRRHARGRRLVALALTVGLLAGPLGTVGLPVIVLGAVALAAAVVLARARRSWAWRPGRPAADAVVLGRDPEGRPVALSDRQLAAHALLVGASGSGKSTTMLTLLGDRIARGHPVVAIDMKGSPAFAQALAQSCAAAGRTLRVWTPQGPAQWNPLAHGTPTALKDKLISAERFSEPHYQRAAERYLQTALRVLEATGPTGSATLGAVVALMEPAALAARAARAPEPLAGETRAYVEGLTRDQLSAVRGIGTRLALLRESDAGRWLGDTDPSTGGGPQVDLGAALDGGDVVLLSINSAVYGTLGAQLGALAVQDLTSASGRRLHTTATAGAGATVAVDEFSALGADNVLSLLARGREAGVGVLLATQELADLERAGRGFRDQVLGITAVTLAHRQEVHESAVAISRMAGTRTVWRDSVTLPASGLGGLLAGGRRPLSGGTSHQHEEPVIHPNLIKRLGTGQLVLISHVEGPTALPVAVRPPPSMHPPAATRRPPAGINRPNDVSRAPRLPPVLRRPGRSPRHRGIESGADPTRDQPAPGVTR